MNMDTIKETLQSRLLNRQGKKRAKAEAEALFDNFDLSYSVAIRPDYTHYMIGYMSLFIEYNTQGKVTAITTY